MVANLHFSGKFEPETFELLLLWMTDRDILQTSAANLRQVILECLSQ